MKLSGAPLSTEHSYGRSALFSVPSGEKDQGLPDTTVLMQFTAAVTHEDKWYLGRALEVEVSSQGRTIEEALANIREALELYFEDEISRTSLCQKPPSRRSSSPCNSRRELNPANCWR